MCAQRNLVESGNEGNRLQTCLAFIRLMAACYSLHTLDTLHKSFKCSNAHEWGTCIEISVVVISLSQPSSQIGGRIERLGNGCVLLLLTKACCSTSSFAAAMPVHTEWTPCLDKLHSQMLHAQEMHRRWLTCSCRQHSLCCCDHSPGRKLCGGVPGKVTQETLC